MPPQQAGDRLESWKDIAAYLGREVRTVQGWEKSEGLPVHRHQHARQGSVYAFRSELDAWRKQRASSPAAAEPAPAKRNIALVAAIVIVLVGVAGYFAWSRFHVAGTGVSTVAVLPFVDMSSGKDQEYFSDGLTEEIIDALSRVPNLHVVARTSAFQFKGKNTDIREIGRQLNVTAVLEGSVRKDGDQVRITAQLNRVTDGFHLWSRTYDRPLRDIFALQREISQAIATQLGAGQIAPPHESTTNLEAYRLYLQGRYAMSDPTAERISTAIAYYEQALAKDPNYALAYAGLADSYSYLGDVGFQPPREVMGKAKEAAQKALKIDDQVAEAHASLGIVANLFEWDWPAAEREFRRALELSPGNAYDHHWFGHYYDAIGRFDDGMREMRKALDLDPLSEMFHMDYGFELVNSRRFQEAVAQFNKLLEINPTNPFGRYALGFALERLGKSADSRAELAKLGNLSDAPPVLMAASGTVYARLGEPDRPRKLLAQLQEMSKKTYVPAFYEAMLAFAIDDKDQGFQLLEEAYGQRSSGFTFLLPDPTFDPVRSDPRFVALMNKVGVPKATWAPR
jgi:serine/threonine-protein kinase